MKIRALGGSAALFLFTYTQVVETRNSDASRRACVLYAAIYAEQWNSINTEQRVCATLFSGTRNTHELLVWR